MKKVRSRNASMSPTRTSGEERGDRNEREIDREESEGEKLEVGHTRAMERKKARTAGSR
jgi:hypothetical protein